ncbi:MAG: zinc-ribbon domain containing protein [Anaerolineae bacterium]|nr:zinc-ribbon domain containing protein [Anaerolineae bacterium]
MPFQDKTLTCRDCGAQFTFTAGEQEFYQQKGFLHPPSRCPECRGKKRNTDLSRPSSGERQMFEVTCSDCGRPARVPFEPRTDKPVYCQECFTARRPARY